MTRPQTAPAAPVGVAGVHNAPASLGLLGGGASEAGAPRVIGLDLSLTGTGIATVHGTSTVKPGDLRGLPRLAYIRGHIAGVREACDPVRLVVIEGPAYSRASGAGHHESAGLWWLVVTDLVAAGVPTLVAGPTVLKRYATGRGNATKADMRMALYQRTDLDLRDDNQVDAWWLRAIGLAHFGHSIVSLPAAQVGAADKLTRPGAS